jgi:dTDP-4-dehydrorhamnose 3,5-epimerase
MNIIQTPIADLLIIEPDVFEDRRGYFYESYNEKKYAEAGIKAQFIQDNQSHSTYGVLRGLHYQLAPYSQAKLVRVLDGNVLDVAVDLRKGSPTFEKWFSVELSGENKLQFYIPKGFAHGFVVLSKQATFFYKCDSFYHPEAERGIKFDDPKVGIDWKIPQSDFLLSSKDKVYPFMDKAEMNFIYK